MDLHRDAAFAFGPASLRTGGLLPYEGRAFIQRDTGLPPAVFDAERDGWLSADNPILVRGLVRILPLAWQGVPSSEYNAHAEAGQIAKLASSMQSTGMHWAGNWRVLELEERREDSIGSYTAALRAAGATRADCWTYSETVGIALVWAGFEDEGTMSLALHVVPASWVSERRVTKPVRGIDVRWSWSEVIDLYTTRIDAEAPGGS